MKSLFLPGSVSTFPCQVPVLAPSTKSGSWTEALPKQGIPAATLKNDSLFHSFSKEMDLALPFADPLQSSNFEHSQLYVHSEMFTF